MSVSLSPTRCVPRNRKKTSKRTNQSSEPKSRNNDDDEPLSFAHIRAVHGFWVGVSVSVIFPIDAVETLSAPGDGRSHNSQFDELGAGEEAKPATRSSVLGERGRFRPTVKLRRRGVAPTEFWQFVAP
jgi:hypothetical protein